MQSEEVVGAALAGRPTSEDGANHSAYLAKVEHFQPDDGHDYAAAWLAQRFRVPAALAETITTLAGLGGRSS